MEPRSAGRESESAFVPAQQPGLAADVGATLLITAAEVGSPRGAINEPPVPLTDFGRRPIAKSKTRQRRRERFRRLVRRIAENECRWQLRNRCLSLDARGCAGVFGLTTREWLKLHSAAEIPAPLHIGRNLVWNIHELSAWLVAGTPNRTAWQIQRDDALRTSTITPRDFFRATFDALFADLGNGPWSSNNSVEQ